MHQLGNGQLVKLQEPMYSKFEDGAMALGLHTFKCDSSTTDNTYLVKIAATKREMRQI